MFDLAIRRTSVVDGTGEDRYLATVYLRDDRIVSIDRSDHDLQAREEIDGSNRVLAPGFIDVHTHDDVALIANPEMTCKVSQGVTTVITGLCGYSAAPFVNGAVPPSEYDILIENDGQRFETFVEYLAAVRQAEPAVNYLPLVGHSTLRVSVMDRLDREATGSEIEAMCRLLDDSMDAGAFGLSSGLAYSMASHASTEELIALCLHMAGRGGFYVTHIRNEADGLLDAVDEALTIGREGGVRVIFSHHKANGVCNHGKTKESLARIDAERATMEVALDVYPYCFSSTALTREKAAGGGKIVIARSQQRPDMVGKTLQQVAEILGCSEEEAVDALEPAGALYFRMAEEDLQRVLKHDLTMIGSDGLPFDEKPHPRLWGSFPRVLSRYVRDIPLLSLEEAIHRMTGLPARVFGLRDRGHIAVGAIADLVLLDAETICDTATTEDPTAVSVGIDKVLINGRPAGQKRGQQLSSTKTH